jgi:hypothetical protein
VRDRVRAGTLAGHKDARGRWRIIEAGLPVDLPAPVDQATLARRVDQLAKDIEAIRTERADQAELMAAIARERDAYRAEASTARDVALRINASARDARTALRMLIDALDNQGEAVSQLLLPGSPADL